jgi:hypothetical protein
MTVPLSAYGLNEGWEFSAVLVTGGAIAGTIADVAANGEIPDLVYLKDGMRVRFDKVACYRVRPPGFPT